MKWRFEKYNGFGSHIEFGVGWLTLMFNRFEDHWYFQIYWMRPNP